MMKPSYYLGKPVESLQTMLRRISELDSRVLPVIPDGYYDSNTFASVRSFQSAHDLPATGEVQWETWQAITAEYDRILPQLQAPVFPIPWSAGQIITSGQQHEHLYLVQAMLTALSHHFAELVLPDITGILDEPTAAGLRWIQHAGNLPETGALTTETWHYLTALYRGNVQTGSPFPPAFG